MAQIGDAEPTFSDCVNDGGNISQYGDSVGAYCDGLVKGYDDTSHNGNWENGSERICHIDDSVENSDRIIRKKSTNNTRGGSTGSSLGLLSPLTQSVYFLLSKRICCSTSDKKFLGCFTNGIDRSLPKTSIIMRLISSNMILWLSVTPFHYRISLFSCHTLLLNHCEYIIIPWKDITPFFVSGTLL
jgi:hypothetical protein